MKTPPEKSNQAPPALGERILRRILRSDEAESIAGDCEVLYMERIQQHGRARARLWYWFQIFRTLWNVLSVSVYWSAVMFKNHFKVAFRHLKKNKAYSVINIAGLGIGMTCCMLILLWVQDELSFDRFHENADRLYRVLYQSGEERYSTTCAPLAAALEAELPEVQMATRYRPIGGRMIKYQDKAFHGDRFCVVDVRFFEMFTFPFIKGDASNALDHPFAMVITEETAEKYFGDEDPLGKTLRLENRFDFQVTGVLKRLPKNSHLQFDVLARFEFLSDLWGENLSSWGSNSHITYVMLQEGADPSIAGSKTDTVYKRNNARAKGSLILYPMTGIHLAPFGTWVDAPPGSMTHVILFSIIAGFILLIACINFINLTTAKSIKRAREVGVRKTLGAQQRDIVRQFYGESILSAGLAFIVAILLIPFFLPTLNALSDKEMTIHVLGNIYIIGGILAITLITVLLSGSYPSLFIASFKPVKALKAMEPTGVGSRVSLRKGLVILQFAVSIFLIIGTFIITGQLRFIHQQDLGYDKQNIITMPVTGTLLQQISPAGREILRNPDIESITISNTLPGKRETTTSQIGWQGKDPNRRVRFEVLWVDLEFLKTFGLEMVDGRFFSRSYITELREGIVINEAAAKTMGFIDESPIGKRLTNTPVITSSQGQDATIIGVIRDFHSRTLHDPIEPLVIKFAPYPRDNLSIRIRPGAIPAALEFLQGIWSRFAPDYDFEYRFFDTVLGGLYLSEMRMGRLFRIFSFLAIFISCLGLFGLAAYSAEQKTKEIGIRKVFGARESSIIWGQSRSFILLVLISSLIAWPLAYLVGRGWLEGFAYRMRLELGIFLLAGIIALGIAFISVGMQVWKAARANPVDSLRYE